MTESNTWYFFRHAQPDRQTLELTREGNFQCQQIADLLINGQELTQNDIKTLQTIYLIQNMASNVAPNITFLGYSDEVRTSETGNAILSFSQSDTSKLESLTMESIRENRTNIQDLHKEIGHNDSLNEHSQGMLIGHAKFCYDLITYHLGTYIEPSVYLQEAGDNTLKGIINRPIKILSRFNDINILDDPHNYLKRFSSIEDVPEASGFKVVLKPGFDLADFFHKRIYNAKDFDDIGAYVDNPPIESIEIISPVHMTQVSYEAVIDLTEKLKLKGSSEFKDDFDKIKFPTHGDDSLFSTFGAYRTGIADSRRFAKNEELEGAIGYISAVMNSIEKTSEGYTLKGFGEHDLSEHQDLLKNLNATVKGTNFATAALGIPMAKVTEIGKDLAGEKFKEIDPCAPQSR